MEFTDRRSQESLRSKVFNSILDDILSGKLKPGETLIESKLAEEFGVSRTPIREALKQLELEGLVVSLPNRRVTVKGISEKDIDDIYVIRKRIEGLAARWATENISEEQLEELRNIVELGEFYTNKGDWEKIEELDGKFHDIIFEASNSKPLRFILSNFHQFIRKAREESLKVEGRIGKTHEEHSSILKAIEAGDANDAEKAIIEHIKSSRRSYNIAHERA